MGGLSVEDILPSSEWTVDLPKFWLDNMNSRIEAKRSGWGESPSSISSYVGCPLRWFSERYAPTRTVEESRANITLAAISGNVVHKCLQIFYTEPPHRRSWDLLLRIRREMMDGLVHGEPNGIADSELVSDYALLLAQPKSTHRTPMWFEKRVVEALDNMEMFDEDPQEVRITSTEQWVRHKVNGITVRGKIDRVVGDRIDDYKTGRPLADDVLIDPLSSPLIASGFYAYAWNKRFPGVSVGPCTEVNLLYLGAGELIQMRIGEEEQAKTAQLLDAVTTEMKAVRETGVIAMTPGKDSASGACGFCPLAGACPAYQESGEDFEGSFDLFGTEDEIAALRAEV